MLTELKKKRVSFFFFFWLINDPVKHPLAIVW